MAGCRVAVVAIEAVVIVVVVGAALVAIDAVVIVAVVGAAVVVVTKLMVGLLVVG